MVIVAAYARPSETKSAVSTTRTQVRSGDDGWSGGRAFGGEDVHGVVQGGPDLRGVARLQLGGEGEVDDGEAVTTQERLVVLGMHAEGDGFTDQAQRSRGGPAGAAERTRLVDQVPHVVGDL